MTASSILPDGSPVRETLTALSASQRIAFVTGLSGVGKSLLVQQLALLAHAAGRRVHLLQWDVCRAAFETPEILARYPEVDGATHMTIRRAVGLWVRSGVRQWHDGHPDPDDMLIGEPPLAGHRLIELTVPIDDDAETLLAGPQTMFVVPVPTVEVRAAIEATRTRTIRRPSHPRESSDAPPNVMRDDWLEIWRLGQRLGLGSNEPAPPFDPALYEAVYRHLLRHRRVRTISIDCVLEPGASVYDLDAVTSELAASADEVRRYVRDAEANPLEA